MANNLSLALKIEADIKNAQQNLNALKAAMQGVTGTAKSASGDFAKTAQATEGVAKAAQSAASGLNKLGQDAQAATAKLGKTRAGVESISTQLKALKAQVVGLTLGNLAVSNLARSADEFKNYESRIKLISRSNIEAQSTFRALMQAANDTGSQFAATAELYTRTYRALGGAASNTEVLAFTKTINQALVVSGTGAQEANAALLQLAQGLAAGALRGEEFNSVSEQAPIILEILQQSLGKTRGELRQMAEAGQLTADVIMTAVAANAESLQKQYESMPLTIGRAINELSNSWMQFIGNSDKVVPISAAVSSAISLIAKNINALVTVLAVVGVAYGARFIAPMITGTGSIVANTAAINAGTAALNTKMAAQVRAAQLTIAMARAVDGETLSATRAAQAYGALAIAKTKAAAVSAGSGLLALAGGWIGLAITGVIGLGAAFAYLSAQAQESEQQFVQLNTTLDGHIDKTNTLIEAQSRLSALGGFADRLNQTDINTQAIDEAKQKLDELIAKRDELQAQRNMDAFGYGAFNTAEIDAYNAKITELKGKVDELNRANTELSDVVRAQLALAFDEAVASGGELAEKLKAIGDPQHADAISLLLPVIKDAETSLAEMKAEAERLEIQVGEELANATMTASEKMDAFKKRIEDTAAKAGLSAQQYLPLIDTLNNIINLQAKVAQAKDAKDADGFMEGLRKQARQSGMTSLERNIDNVKNNSKLSDEQKKEAEALYRQIDTNGQSRRTSTRATSGTSSQARQAASQAKRDAEDAKRLADEAANKTRDLNVQYLRLIGQESKADLLDTQNRYNQLLAMMQKANNVEGISLVKKMLPLEEAKIQLDGIRAEVDKAMQRQSAQEQQVQAQVSTGLLTHFEGQQRLKDIYSATVSEIEKQLPLLQQLSQMPGAQGQAAGVMMEQMRIKMEELKATGNELEKAFKDGLTQGIQSSLMGLANGTMSLSDAVKNLALSVVNSMAQIAAQQLAMQATSAIGGWFGAAMGAAGGTVAAATGGYIRGPGTSTSDSIPARLSDGEFVINAAMVRRYGVGFMHAINRGTLRKFSEGGLVSQPAMPSVRDPGLSQKAVNGQQNQVVASPVNVQQTLVLDSAEAFTSGLATTEGKRSMITFIRANRATLKQELGL
ncbi:tape measure protein [Glaesserella sp.]|uniref:tape measure protein n=1 Tax=Glaesserella sp. TaxID=2094731 RepID=UPI00359F65A9